MLFDSSIRKELARSFGATLVVLITVVMTMMLIRTLGRPRGQRQPSDVMLVMGFTVLGQLPTILGLSLFVAMVGTLSRMYRDSEMVIWFASGRGLASLLRRCCALPGRCCWSLLCWRWWSGPGPTADPGDQDPVRAAQRRGPHRPRRVPGIGQRPRVFFIDKDTPDASRQQRLHRHARAAGESVTSAQSARLECAGRAHGAAATASAWRPRQTNRGCASASLRNTAPDRRRPAGRRTDAGAASPRHLGSGARPAVSGRTGLAPGLPLAALNFVVLGLAMASVNPRPRSTSLVLALLAFMVYYNLMTVGQAGWAGRVGMLPFCWRCMAARWRWAAGDRQAQPLVAARPAATRERCMRTIRRLIYREVVVSVAFVTLAFLALFFFFDLVDEMRWVGGWAWLPAHACPAVRGAGSCPATCTSCCPSPC
jgi:lipopolysaccharide export system permease protein